MHTTQTDWEKSRSIIRIARVHDHAHQAFKNLAPAADLIVERDAPVIIGEPQSTEPHESSGSSWWKARQARGTHSHSRSPSTVGARCQKWWERSNYHEEKDSRG